MLEEDNENLTLSPGYYDFMQKEIGLDSIEGITDMIMPGNMANGNGMMDPMMNMMNAEDSSLGDMEDYKFVQENFVLFPPSEPQQLCSTDYPGPLSFEVFVDPNVMKNPWEYSPVLHKIYIDMKHKFPINFSVKNHNNQNLFIRIMPMYQEDRYVQDLVHRCINHGQLQDPTNAGVPELVTQHIIRCDNNRAQYFGDKNVGKRLSIVIPLSSPQAGTDSVKEFFHFVCKSSCVGGMNRRPIQVIFTLEDDRGTVLGRRVLCVRICSCPKRDREKDENKREKHGHHSGKKRKVEKKAVTPPPLATETEDTKEYQVTVVGKKNYKHLLRSCKALMSDEISEAEGGNTAPFKKCRDEAAQLLSQMSD